jgi:carbon-monoxide dehydrogenase small subunit
VQIDGKPVKSCTTLAAMTAGHEVRTVEALEVDGVLDPLQQGFHECHALHCGFCTPGILTTAHALLSEEPDANADRIREVLSGNLCRCTGYVSIIDAVLDARAAYQTQKAVE